MKISLLLIIAVAFFITTQSQDKGMRAQFQGGLTCNFLTKSDPTYSGALGGGSSYDISEITPLPGFVTGFLWQSQRGSVLFRTGILMSYHVNSAVMDYHNWLYSLSGTTSTNIKTRFRNLYLQVPLEFGIPIGRKRSFAIWGGVKGSILAANAGIWEAYTIGNEIEWITSGPVIKEIDTTYLSQKPGMNSYDVAVELAFTKLLSDKWITEARIYKGFNIVNSNAYSSYTDRLKQLTFEVTIGLLLRKKSDSYTSPPSSNY